MRRRCRLAATLARLSGGVLFAGLVTVEGSIEESIAEKAACCFLSTLGELIEQIMSNQRANSSMLST